MIKFIQFVEQFLIGTMALCKKSIKIIKGILRKRAKIKNIIIKYIRNKIKYIRKRKSPSK